MEMEILKALESIRNPVLNWIMQAFTFLGEETVFMVLAIIGVVVYLWVDSTIGTYIVIGGMAFKMVECCLRMLK